MPECVPDELATAFSLKFIGDKEYKLCAKKGDIEDIYVTWKNGRVDIGRELFIHEFPKEVSGYISKCHCIITARRVKKSLNQVEVPFPKMQTKPSTELSPNISLMNELSIDKKDSPKKSKKKNPSIKLNGEKIVDSDLEEKQLTLKLPSRQH
jgi:hypothetical protein